MASLFHYIFVLFPLFGYGLKNHTFSIWVFNCFKILFTGTLQKHFMLQAFSLRLFPSLVHFNQTWVSFLIDRVLVFWIRCLLDIFKISFCSWSKNGNTQSGKQQISGRLWKKEGNHSLVHPLVMMICLFLQVHLPVQMYGSVPNSSLSLELLTKNYTDV